MDHVVKIIGINEEGKQGLPQLFIDWIYQSEILIGGERQLAFFPDYKGEKISIKNKIHSLLEHISDVSHNAIILASGDPLFFGIGGSLVSQLHNAKISFEIYPSVSSIQLAFARAKQTWQDAKFISVHGRKMLGLAQKVSASSKVALLTDRENHPGKVAAYLLEFNLTNYRAFVGENLGMQNERCHWYSLEELSYKADTDFHDLNVMILVRSGKHFDLGFGIPDSEFSYPEKPNGLITKKEIRVLSLSSLNLKSNSVVWDIGSCTGSVAIEAARIAYEGQIFAIEKNKEHMEHCRRNSRKFHTDITMLESDAPGGLSHLPDPDAVFIGGSGGSLREILRIASDRLKPGGRIVVNAITLETLNTAMDYFRDNEFDAEVTVVQVSRSRAISEHISFQALNPVFILTACQSNSP